MQLFRDCLRLVRHVAGDSPKGVGLRTMVRSEFRKHAAVADPHAVDALRASAVRALSNYMLYESGAKDPKVKKRMDEQGQPQPLDGSGPRRASISGGLVPPRPTAGDREKITSPISAMEIASASPAPES